MSLRSNFSQQTFARYLGVSFHLKDADLFKLLTNTNQPLKLYIFKVYLLALGIGLTISFILEFFVPNAESPDFEIGLSSFILIVFVAPILETFLMIPIISLIKKVTPDILYISIVSALIWAIMHSLQVPLWGIGVFALFFLMSMAYQHWDAHSRGHALLVVMMIHALNNASIFTLVALES